MSVSRIHIFPRYINLMVSSSSFHLIIADKISFFIFVKCARLYQGYSYVMKRTFTKKYYETGSE
jgi:hypothetical protein